LSLFDEPPSTIAATIGAQSGFAAQSSGCSARLRSSLWPRAAIRLKAADPAAEI
jgi:hypothetical protein